MTVSAPENSTVAVVGLGAMGRALAGALLDRGVAVTVWNRTPGRAPGLVARGAVEAEDLVAAVTSSDLIVVCLTDHAAVLGALTVRMVGGSRTGRPDPCAD